MAGVYAGGCVLLVVAGGAKLWRPQAARTALAAAGAPVPGWAVRAGGATEAAVGMVALASGGPAAAWGVAACYGVFVGYLAAVLLRPDRPAARCGCFGEAGAPVHPVQVAVDAAMAGAAAWVAAAGGVAGGAGGRTAAAVLGLAVAWVAWLVLVPLPGLLAAVREAAR